MIKGLSYLALLYAALGWGNERYFHWVQSPWFSHYSEFIVIGIFGVYRCCAEKNAYTRRRIAVLTTVVITFWFLLPTVLPTPEPSLGYFKNHATLGRSLHLPMTLTFFLALGLVLLFGRRVVCSWACPCVGIRDTVGNAFRTQTIRTRSAWRLRHLKWILGSFYFALFVLVLTPSAATRIVVDRFFGTVSVLYFVSLFLIPVTGNRNWCRWLCPYGHIFGLLNKIGFYSIKADRDRCTSCGRCDRECDMGIPVSSLVKAEGRVKATECVGCGRCVNACSLEILQVWDVRRQLGGQSFPKPR